MLVPYDLRIGACRIKTRRDIFFVSQQVETQSQSVATLQKTNVCRHIYLTYNYINMTDSDSFNAVLNAEKAKCNVNSFN